MRGSRGQRPPHGRQAAYGVAARNGGNPMPERETRRVAAPPTADKLTRTEFRKYVAAQAASLRARIEAEGAGLDDAPDAIAERRRRVLAPDGFETFCRTYFPHYVTGPNSRLHDHLYHRLPQALAAPNSQHDAIAAPRGEAKSTLCAALFPVWCLARRTKRFMLLIADAYHQAALLLEAIKAELEANPRLKVDFPELVGPGRDWQDGEIVTRCGAKLVALGSGKRLRGLRHGAHRPDLVVLDDIENDENVRSPEQRDKLEAWVDQAVLNVGGAGVKCDVLLIGTLLHYDSVLARKLRHPLWQGVRVQAIARWPDRMDLWDRWEERLRNHGLAAADRLFADHGPEMTRGAEVSWPAVRPLADLMKIRVRVGRHAFDTEYQNDPVAGEAAAFGTLTFWVDRRSDWLMVGACDPSLGRASRGADPSALLVGGFDRETGVLDVVEAAIQRRLPDRLIEDVIALQAEHACVKWAIEAVQFQAFFADELVRRSAARGRPVPVVPVTPRSDKTLRIQSLQPHVANGLIRVHAGLTTLIDQLRHWPAADHDDGPDALEMLWSLALGLRTPVAYAGGGPRHRFGDPDADRDRGGTAGTSRPRPFRRGAGAW